MTSVWRESHRKEPWPSAFSNLAGVGRKKEAGRAISPERLYHQELAKTFARLS
jgi:hypothetical protein